MKNPSAKAQKEPMTTAKAANRLPAIPISVPRHEAEAPADPAHQLRGRNGADRDTEIERGDRQGGKRFVRTQEIGAGEAADGDRDRRSRADDGIRRRQDQRIAARLALLTG